VSHRWKCSGPAAGGPDPPQTGPGSPRAHSDPRVRGAWASAQGRYGAATCPTDAGIGTGASLPLEASPPTALNAVVEACSAAAERGAAFDRLHCRAHLTKVSSNDRTVGYELPRCTIQPQAPRAQHTSAALNGEDGTTLSIMSPTPQLRG
jgi:hypothetical protein